MFRLRQTDPPLGQIVVFVTVEVVLVAALTPAGDGVRLGAVSILIDDATVASQPSQLGPVRHGGTESQCYCHSLGPFTFSHLMVWTPGEG